MPGNEIGVKVSEENMTDPKPKVLRITQVLFNIALRIDDNGGPTGLVPKQIGCVSQATQVVLLQNHGASTVRRTARAMPKSEENSPCYKALPIKNVSFEIGAYRSYRIFRRLVAMLAVLIP